MSEAYFQRVRENIVQDVAHAIAGSRNDTLNVAAYTLGRHAHLAPKFLDNAIIDLHAAAKAIGLRDQEIRTTIGSGFQRGGENPKQLENSEQLPYTPSEFDRLVDRLQAEQMLLKDDKTREEKIQSARQVWDRSVDITSDNIQQIRPALLYLNGRQINARSAVGIARYSPNVYDGPALIFPARTQDGEISGVQAVLLTEDGKKRFHNDICKYSRGVIRDSSMTIPGGAPIIMVEGPEDALSIREAAGDDATVICTFGKAGMKTHQVPRASDVTVCADPDLDVDPVVDNLSGDGSTKVYVVRFNELGGDGVKDANDMLREAGADKLREALSLAKPYEVDKQEIVASERNFPSEWSYIDPASIPKRQWIYGTHYVRSYVSVLAAAPGVGKTSMQVAEALSITSGRNLLDVEVKERCNVWLINLEDPLEEMQRRIAAAMIHYDIKPEEIRGRLFLDAGRDVAIRFAMQTQNGVIINEDLRDYLITEVEKKDIGAIIIDPWVSVNDISENDNSAMDKAVAVAREIADATGCAVVITHHMRKLNGEEATIDSVRGAASLIGAARAARIINKVSQEDAMKLGVNEQEALGIFRIDDGKSNMAPPREKATYCRMQGVRLPNGEYVGVATPYKLPDMFDGISAKDARELQRLVGAAAERDEPFRQDVRAANWVGKAVAVVLDLDLEKKHEKTRCKALVKKWLDTNVLRAETWPSKRDGREVQVVVVGEWISREEAGL